MCSRGRAWVLASALGGPLLAQNLVPDPGFEQYTTPPDSYGQICRLSGWTSPNGLCSMVTGMGTPDAYHLAGSNGARPPSTFWATVSPHSGGGMAGFAPWYVGLPNFREYIGTTLTAPLQPGQTYEVGFWLTNGISSLHPYGISRLGVAFSTTPLVQVGGGCITYTPQVAVQQVVYSTTWQYFLLSFTAEEESRYMYIGNFVPYASTVSQKIGTVGNSGAYYYIDDISVQVSSSLPVGLLFFRAHADDAATVTCTWATASEHANDHFNVQRSADGSQFMAVGVVAGAGDAQDQRDYRFVDPAPLPGISYYRLQQVDVDGTTDLSDAVAVDRGAEPGLQVWPVPSQGSVTIACPESSPEAWPVEVLDESGRVVRRIAAPGGDHAEVTGLSAGTYLVRCGDPSIRPQRLVVQ